MNILKRSLAPITDAAWEEITEQSNQILRSLLTVRKFVDISGPHGWDYGAVQLGRLDMPKQNPKEGVQYGIHKVLPLTEIKVPFRLSIQELDNINRGAEDADLGPLEEAARKVAGFEEKAAYYGFKTGKIQGLKERSDYKPLSCPKDAKEVLHCVPEGISQFKEASIEGPYYLIVNPKEWREITSYVEGYPLKKQVQDNLDAEILFCPNIEDMFLVTGRGGDYKLTLGGDISIGYSKHDTEEVELYFAESFTFQVLEPSAVLMFD